MRLHCTFFAVLLSALGLASSARAQLNDLNVKGKVVGLDKLAIILETDKGERWFASVDPVRVEDNVRYTGLPDPDVEVKGTEGTDFLKPGMFVRFEADVEKKRAIKGVVTELTVIGGGKDNAFGLLPGSGEAKAAGSERMLVVGQLTAASRGAITVAFPDGKEVKDIKAKLDPAAVVKIQSNDYLLARPGDEIEVKGYYGKAPRAFATQVKVTRVAKADKPGKKPVTPAKKPGPGKKPGDAAAPADFGAGDPREAEPADPAVPAKIIPGKILKVN